MPKFRVQFSGRVRALAVTIASFALLASASSAAAARLPTLRPGAHGATVRTLQRDLSAVGIRTSVDGYYLARTRSSVVRFKRRMHLPADGVVGARMWGALQASIRRIAAAQAAAAAAATEATTAAASAGGNGGAGLASTSAAATTTSTLPALTLTANGLVNIPAGIPTTVTAMLQAANQIAKLPYVWGGGHGSWSLVSGYDCSGSVSYILHAAGLMNAANGDPSVTPFDSEQFAGYGAAGASSTGWATLWVNAATHVYVHISNLWFDTAGLDSSTGSRWTTTRISPAAGFVARHPIGW